jgi:hypothetical protein
MDRTPLPLQAETRRIKQTSSRGTRNESNQSATRTCPMNLLLSIAESLILGLWSFNLWYFLVVLSGYQCFRGTYSSHLQGWSRYGEESFGSKSKSCYDRRSVSQYVVVSSSLWNLWPDIIFCLKVAVLSLWGALSDERSGLSSVSHFHQCLVHCQRFHIIYIVHVTCFKYM